MVADVLNPKEQRSLFPRTGCYIWSYSSLSQQCTLKPIDAHGRGRKHYGVGEEKQKTSMRPQVQKWDTSVIRDWLYDDNIFSHFTTNQTHALGIPRKRDLYWLIHTNERR